MSPSSYSSISSFFLAGLDEVFDASTEPTDLGEGHHERSSWSWNGPELERNVCDTSKGQIYSSLDSVVLVVETHLRIVLKHKPERFLLRFRIDLWSPVRIGLLDGDEELDEATIDSLKKVEGVSKEEGVGDERFAWKKEGEKER